MTILGIVLIVLGGILGLIRILEVVYRKKSVAETLEQVPQVVILIVAGLALIFIFPS